MEKIYNFIFYRTFHRETAEDLTSETFFRALKSIDSFDVERPFAPWLYRIAHNSIIDHFRTRRESVDIDELWDLGEEDTTVHDLDVKIDYEGVKKHLGQLSQDQRDIIIMRIWDELPYRDIAQIIGKSEANCKMIFSRGVAKLRELVAVTALMLMWFS
jgi:RNA polymerase sigma-70 factor (ECF subfamily)